MKPSEQLADLIKEYLQPGCFCDMESYENWYARLEVAYDKYLASPASLHPEEPEEQEEIWKEAVSGLTIVQNDEDIIKFLTDNYTLTRKNHSQ